MMFLRRELFTAALVLSLGGCLFASMRGDADAPGVASLTSAREHASSAAPSLPILVLRTARDELALAPVDRANVAMIVDVAELDVRTLDRARAALLEGLAISVDEGRYDEVRIAILIEQMEWAAGEVAPKLRRGLEQLYEMLTPEQRQEVRERVEAKLPSWAPVWATDTKHRWLEAWPERELPDFAGDLARTSRAWGQASADRVRVALPRLDAAQRRALAASLRTGVE